MALGSALAPILSQERAWETYPVASGNVSKEGRGRPAGTTNRIQQLSPGGCSREVLPA